MISRNIVPQKAMIKNGGKYLILKRSPNSFNCPSCWDFPGGCLEQGEDVFKSVEREVFEETALIVKAINHVFVFHEIVMGENLVFIVYSCEKISGRIKLSHEHTEFKRATGEEIPSLECENYLRAFCNFIL